MALVMDWLDDMMVLLEYPHSKNLQGAKIAKYRAEDPEAKIMNENKSLALKGVPSIMYEDTIEKNRETRRRKREQDENYGKNLSENFRNIQKRYTHDPETERKRLEGRKKYYSQNKKERQKKK